jgi:putative membrane protein insertion efficiency factor
VKRRLPALYARFARLVRELFLLPVHAYRTVISPNLGPRCKYYPTCSTYGVAAVRELGVVKGSIVAAWRVLRCNPFSRGGVDELADRRLFPDHSRAQARDPEAAT